MYFVRACISDRISDLDTRDPNKLPDLCPMQRLPGTTPLTLSCTHKPFRLPARPISRKQCSLFHPQRQAMVAADENHNYNPVEAYHRMAARGPMV